MTLSLLERSVRGTQSQRLQISDFEQSHDAAFRVLVILIGLLKQGGYTSVLEKVVGPVRAA